jgi:heme oxygenase (mycobilin-producing)
VLVVTRHRPDDPEQFEATASHALSVLASRPGCEYVELLSALDEAGLYLIVSRWQDVGSYRRALSSFEVKMSVVPLLASAADEPSAFGVHLRATPNGEVQLFDHDRAPDADSAGPL